MIIASVLGKRMTWVVVAAAIVGAGITWGSPIDWHAWGARTTVVRTVIGDYIAEQAGETLMTSQQIRDNMGELHNEIVRLQWLEAESSVAAENMDSQVQALVQRSETLREDLLLLTVHDHGDGIVVLHNGQEVPPSQLDTVMRRVAADLQLAEERTQLYNQSHALYVDTSLKARALWQQAEQNMVAMDAYLALYEATQVDESTVVNASDEPGSPRTLLVALQEQVERNQRIGELREKLEQGFAGEVLVELGE